MFLWLIGKYFTNRVVLRTYEAVIEAQQRSDETLVDFGRRYKATTAGHRHFPSAPGRAVHRLHHGPGRPERGEPIYESIGQIHMLF